VDFFDLAGAVQRICEAFDVGVELVASAQPALVPSRSARVVGRPRDAAGPIDLGFVGQLLPAIAAGRDLPGQDPVYVAELDLDALTGPSAVRDEVRVAPLPRFPSIVRDLSILVDEALPAASVRGTIRAVAPETLADIREFDRYRGKGIPEGSVSLSLRLTFRAPSRTLTDAEVDAAMGVIMQALEARHRARRR
jgi:phenylalanyl-tRNA synthetase beta chain